MGYQVDWLVSQLKVVGGAETFLRETAPRLRKAGWNLRVITFVSGGPLINELKNDEVPVIELDARHKYDLGAFTRLIKIWKSKPPDLVHTHLYHAGLIGRIVARFLNISPVIVHQHGPQHSRSRHRTLSDKITSRWVNRYVTSCEAVSQILKLREGIKDTQIIVIPDGINIIQSPVKLPPDWPIAPNKVGLVCVGRLSPEKGQFWLLKALANPLLHKADIHVVFMGDGKMSTELLDLSTQLGLNEMVSFVGMRRDILEWLPNFDIFVLPSDWEGISLALLEAMATGIPVVATAVGGTPEVVVDGETGLLVPPRDPEALAESITRLLNDPEMRQRMGQAGRQRVQDHFTIEETVLKTEHLYNTLLEEKVLSR